MDKLKKDRLEVIKSLCILLYDVGFQVDCVVKDQPKGVFITIEVTQQEMNELIEKANYNGPMYIKDSDYETDD